MAKSSLKKEQVQLLRFEKELLALGAGLAALNATAAKGAEAAVGESAAEHAQKLQDAYLALVESVQTAHTAIEQNALALGVDIMQVRGQPKQQVIEAARSLFGLG